MPLPLIPIAWAAGIGAAGGGIYSVWDEVSSLWQSYAGKVDELADRLRDLDFDDARWATTVEKWASTLDQLVTKLEVPLPPADPAGSIKHINEQIGVINQAEVILKRIKDVWPKVKDASTDWGRDVPQAFSALGAALIELESAKSEFTKYLKEAVKQKRKKVRETAGVDVYNVAKEIERLHNAITDLDGVPPIYETTIEKRTKELAGQILQGQYTATQAKKFAPHLESLKDSLEQLYKDIVRQKGAGSNRPLSKRAVRRGVGDKDPGQGERGARRVPKGAVKMQKYLNYLHVRYGTDFGLVGVDGIYGNNTAQSLITIMSKVPSLAKDLRVRAGVNPKIVGNIKVMRAHYLPAVTKVLGEWYRDLSGMTERESRREIKEKTKSPVSDEEIKTWLHDERMRLKSRGEISPYYYLDSMGYDLKEMVSLVRKHYIENNRLTDIQMWNPYDILALIKGRYLIPGLSGR